MERRRSQRRTGRSIAAGLACATLAIAALPASAARVMQVRVGEHPTFTRVVFELDRAAGYQVLHTGGPERPVLEVRVDAETRPHALGANGDVRKLSIDAGPRAVARIELRKPGLRLKEMMLSDPPRIVLDLMRSEGATAATAPKPKVAKPAPEVAKPAPATPKPAPEPAKPAAETAKPPAETAKPAAQTAKPEPKPAAETAQPAPAPATPSPATKAIPPTAAVEPQPAVEPPADAAPEPSEAEPAEAKPAHPPISPALPSGAMSPAPKPVPTPAAPKAVPPAASEPGWLERLSGSLWLGGVALAVLVLVVGIVAWRRHRALPNDLDVAAIAEEVESGADAHGAPGTAERADAGAAGGSLESLFDAKPPQPAAPTAMRPPQPAPAPTAMRPPQPKMAPLQPAAAPAPKPAAPPTAAPAPKPAAPPPPAAADDPMESLFDDEPDGDLSAAGASEGEATMDPNMDLPGQRSATPPAMPPKMGGAAAPGPDVARLLQQLEQRIQSLEARLDDVNEAREKLERQVAAQSEELRVQRAAIARTQRALRTMSRGEEEKATEPALRDGDQTKTRVNV